MLSLCGIVVSLQQTIVLPLLAELPRLLGASPADVSWLVTATLLSGAVATPSVSRLADMYGKRRFLLVALAITVLGSLVGALSSSLSFLVLARALQGVGVALVPVGIAIMRDELPRHQVPIGVSMMSAALAIGAGAGLPLSGLLSTHLDWHSCFWVTGVVGVLLMIGAGALIPESPVRTGGAFDLRGAALLSVALIAILLALSRGGEWGWASATTLGLVAVGLATLATWVPVELRTPPAPDRPASGRPPSRPDGERRVGLRRLRDVHQHARLDSAASDAEGHRLWPRSRHAARRSVDGPDRRRVRASGPGLGLEHASVWSAGHAAGGQRSDDHRLLGQSGLERHCGTGRRRFGPGRHGLRPRLWGTSVPDHAHGPSNGDRLVSGLNVLLRSVGTSTASAATAAVTTATVIELGLIKAPSHAALMALFVMAASASSTAAVVAAPMLRMREYDVEADRSGAENRGTDAQVVRGEVLGPDGASVGTAVVTALTPEGRAVAWGQTDGEGRFAVAIPQADDYLVVTAADGWRPRSWILRLDAADPEVRIGLRERRTVAGAVLDAEDEPVVDALVVLTRQTGEEVGSTRTDHQGRYGMLRPPSGRYVVTASAGHRAVGARAVALLDSGGEVDLVLGTPLAGA
nr:MFS transporter [Nocardioides faecalis]